MRCGRIASTNAPEAAIQHLLDQQTADWNRGDVEAFMKGYEDSPTTTFVGQTVQYGYATILERYRKLYPTPAAMGKLTFSHLAIRVLDSDYAVATGNFHLDRTPPAAAMPTASSPCCSRGIRRAGRSFWTTPTGPADAQICSTSLSLLRHISSMRRISSSVSF